MPTLIGASLWIDFTRARSPRSIKRLVVRHHGAEVVTFDADYQKIASVSNLQVKLLRRPAP
jgi:hypothetical protein